MLLRRPQEWVSGCERQEVRAHKITILGQLPLYPARRQLSEREAKCSQRTEGNTEAQRRGGWSTELCICLVLKPGLSPGQEDGGVGLNRAGTVRGGWPSCRPLGALGLLQAASDPPFDPCVLVPWTCGAASAVGNAGA